MEKAAQNYASQGMINLAILNVTFKEIRYACLAGEESYVI
jgi:hypothetical protein